MIRICLALAQAGYEVLLIGRTLPHSPPLPDQPYAQKRLSCFFHRGKAFYLEYNLRLLFFLLVHRFDAVCAADLDTLAPAFTAARLKGKPVVYDAHEYFTEVPELIGRPHTRRVWELLARAVVPRVDRAYTVGPALAEILSARYGVPFEAVRNVPVRKLNEAPSAKAPAPVVLYQGALNRGRGLEQAIDAMSLLPGVTLWLAGEGDLSQTLRERVRLAGLQDQVRFLGRLSPDDLSRETPKAWIGLNLLEAESLSYYYSLANKAFDYVQAGIPSLQMDFPEYRRLNAEWECFLLLPSLDADAIADAIRSLLADTGRYQNLAANCRQAAEIWNWEAESPKLITLYSGLFITRQR
ncbi:MAG: glycosyltransferase [Haliscomenobacter sp.]|nr:glycosyltransferase [Haliscomenobacter sp.]